MSRSSKGMASFPDPRGDVGGPARKLSRGDAEGQFTQHADNKDVVDTLARYHEGLAHRSMGVEALRTGRHTAAEKHFRTAMGCMGPEADLTAYLCSVYAKTQRYDCCEAEMSKAVGDGCDDPSAVRKLAQAQWKASRREKAMETLLSGLRRLGNHCELLMQLGLFHAARQDMTQARQYLACAAQADASNADAHYYLALVEAAQGNAHQAARCFQRAWQARPDDMMLALQSALSAKAAAESGHPMTVQPPEARPAPAREAHLRQLAAHVRSEPDFIDAFLALPEGQGDGELFTVLADVLTVALQEYPRYADLHFRFSRIVRRLGRYELAIRHAHKALDINPGYVQAMVQLARLYHEAGRGRVAIEHVENAIQSGADWPDVHCLAGELLATYEMPGRARRHFRRALGLKAGYTRAREGLAALAA